MRIEIELSTRELAQIRRLAKQHDAGCGLKDCLYGSDKGSPWYNWDEALGNICQRIRDGAKVPPCNRVLSRDEDGRIPAGCQSGGGC